VQRKVVVWIALQHLAAIDAALRVLLQHDGPARAEKAVAENRARIAAAQAERRAKQAD
jgi:hypothetical protein